MPVAEILWGYKWIFAQLKTSFTWVAQKGDACFAWRLLPWEKAAFSAAHFSVPHLCPPEFWGNIPAAFHRAEPSPYHTAVADPPPTPEALLVHSDVIKILIYSSKFLQKQIEVHPPVSR